VREGEDASVSEATNELADHDRTVVSPDGTNYEFVAQLRSCALGRAACRVRWSRSGMLGADRAAWA
jgi:hypothetical protein